MRSFNYHSVKKLYILKIHIIFMSESEKPSQGFSGTEEELHRIAYDALRAKGYDEYDTSEICWHLQHQFCQDDDPEKVKLVYETMMADEVTKNVRKAKERIHGRYVIRELVGFAKKSGNREKTIYASEILASDAVLDCIREHGTNFLGNFVSFANTGRKDVAESLAVLMTKEKVNGIEEAAKCTQYIGRLVGAKAEKAASETLKKYLDTGIFGSVLERMIHHAHENNADDAENQEALELTYEALGKDIFISKAIEVSDDKEFIFLANGSLRACDDWLESYFKGIYEVSRSIKDMAATEKFIESIRRCNVDEKLYKLAESVKDKDAFIAACRMGKKYSDDVAGRFFGALADSSPAMDKETVITASRILENNEISSLFNKLEEKVRNISIHPPIPRLMVETAALFKEEKTTKSVIEITEKIIDRSREDTDAPYSFVCGLTRLSTTGAEPSEKKRFIERLVNLAENLYEKDLTTAMMVCQHAPTIVSIFGGKSLAVFDYLERRRDRDSIIAINRIKNRFSHNLIKSEEAKERMKRVAESLEKVKIQGEIGNKQTERLIKLASNLGYSDLLGLEPEITESLQDSYANTEKTLKNYAEKKGIKDMKPFLKFLPWVIAEDETALKVLQGEKIEKNGISGTYRLERRDDFDLEAIKKEIQTYAENAGVEIRIDGNDIFSLKSAAESLMSAVEKKKELGKEIRDDIKPNLSRILNLTHKSSKNYIVSIDPSDLEGQMEALQNISSCLSPSGCNFHHTQKYLKHPNTFWAVIKEDGKNGKIVGRFTLFRGKQENKDFIARVSNIYSTASIEESSIDESLKQYAKESGAEVITGGKISIPGLGEAYDDLLCMFEIDSKKEAPSIST